MIGYHMPQLNQIKRTSEPQDEKLNFNVGHSIKDASIEFPKECKALNESKIQKQFWTSDLHDGTRIDHTSLLSSLNQTIILAGVKQRNSPYAKIFFSKPGIEVYSGLSDEIKAYSRHNHVINQDIIERNFKYYDKNELFKKVTL